MFNRRLFVSLSVCLMCCGLFLAWLAPDQHRARAATAPPFLAPLIINEYLAQPPTGIAGDANGDGVRSASQDEFVELVNVGATPLDISAFTIWDATQQRFAFPSGKIIPPGEAAIVFGGGTPVGSFGNCRANGLVFAVGGSGLSLNDSGDSIIVKDNLGAEVTRKDYPPPSNTGNDSLTRNPDITGAFVGHLAASGGASRFSPGTRIDGSPFSQPVPFIASISPDSAVAGAGLVPIAVVGTNFESGSLVRVDGAQVTTSFSSATLVNAIVPPSVTSLAGPHSVTVENPGPLTSNPVTFRVLPAIGINELLADPPDGAAGDANGDGVRDASDDEFIEVVNRTESPVDVSGYSISDADQKRFAFPFGSVIPASEAVVIFGGGHPTGEFGNATVNGLVFTSSLSLNNGGDTITLKDGGNNVVETVSYGSEGGQNESINRDPEVTGTHFAKHSAISGAGGRKFSPGTHVDGSPFSIGARISSISPDRVPLGSPEFDLTVVGADFESGSLIFVDSISLPTTFGSNTILTGRVLSLITSFPGAHQVFVRSQGGNRSNSRTLTVIPPPPTVSNVTPRVVQVGSPAFTLFVLGKDFDSGAKVLVEGTQVTTSFSNPGELHATVPASFASSAGQRRVRVRNSDDQESGDINVEVVLPFIRLSAISPTLTTAGASGFTLSLNGSNFKSGAVALFNNVVLPTTLLSASQLRAEVGGELIAMPGPRSVAVQNVDGGSSNELVFQVLPDAPRISSIDPPTSVEGSGDLKLAISGEKFQRGAIVRLIESLEPGEQLDAIFASSSLLQAILPARLFQRPGSVNLRVENPDFGFSNIVSLKVLIKDALVINEYLADPPEGTAGDANGDGTRSSSQDEFVELLNRTGESMDISAYTLSDADSVRHVFASGTVVPPYEAVVVFGGGTPQGKFGNAADNKLVFRASSGGLSLNNGGDTIRLTDASGRVIQGINYTAFEGGAGQSLNRDPDGDGGSFTLHSLVADDSSLLFSPGTRASGKAFTTKPSLTTLNPSSVRAGAAGFALVISGSDFLAGSEVLFGDSKLPTTFRSDSEIEAQVDSSLLVEPGARDVQVRNPRGELSSPREFLIVGDPPRLTRLSPETTGTGAEGLKVEIQGERFQRRAFVTINGEQVQTMFSSEASVLITAPDKLFTRVAQVELRLTNEDGNVSNALTLTVENGPLITRLSRTRVKSGRGALELTIGGVAFKEGIVLFVNDTAVETTFVSDVEFTATIPAELTATPVTLALQARHPNGGRSNRATLRVVP